MCGILGIAGEVNKEKLIKALSLLEHRGPDNSQIYINGKSSVGLGHQRLSIIDLSSKANQPMHKDDLTIVFNGEIYNYQELQKKYNLKCNTKSDTEVLLNLFSNYSINTDKFINELNGMFAFAVYDKKNETLFLARDRAGIKPLYYYYDGKSFIFASEIKALFELGAPKEINKEVLTDFFNYQIQVGDETLFKGIRILEPGRCIILSLKSMASINKSYWSPEYKQETGSSEDLLNNLKESVQRQMVADVPVGTFLSGGLDSSIITALAAKLKPDIKTFTAGFEGYEEEIKNARKTSQSLGIENYNVLLSPKMFIDSLPGLIRYYDQPISFASSVALHFVSKLAKEHGIKVVLTGEGADELFAGYSRYKRITDILLINRGEGIFLGEIDYFIAKKFFKDPRYLKNLELMLLKNNYDYLTGINAILPNRNKNHPLRNIIKNLFNKGSNKLYDESSILNGLLYLDWHTYLQELLTKQDRMSMSVSIESRVPFLDNKIIDFANSLCYSQKQGKAILKEAAKEILPKEIINRKKIGFTVPLDKWFKGPLKSYIEEQLNNPICYKFFGEDYVKKILKQNKRHDCSLQIWCMLNFKLWYGMNFK